jgi:hypothetical protein
MSSNDFGAFFYSEKECNGRGNIGVYKDIFGKLHRYSYMRSSFPFKKKNSWYDDAEFIGFGWFYGSYTAYCFYNNGLASKVQMKP